jgi:hypothetical protein
LIAFTKPGIRACLPVQLIFPVHKLISLKEKAAFPSTFSDISVDCLAARNLEAFFVVAAFETVM